MAVRMYVVIKIVVNTISCNAASRIHNEDKYKYMKCAFEENILVIRNTYDNTNMYVFVFQKKLQECNKNVFWLGPEISQNL